MTSYVRGYTGTLAWEAPKVKCHKCKRTVPQGRFILGKEEPLGPLEHYCRDCAKAFNIKDEEVIHRD